MIYWRSIKDNNFGLSKRISDEMYLVATIKPENLLNIRDFQACCITSDYSGSHKESKYNTYSFLLGDIPKFSLWDQKRSKFRKEKFHDIEKVSFKNFNKKWYSKLLPEFLSIANNYEGILFNFIIEKKIKNIVKYDISPNKFPEFVYAVNNSWNNKSFERLSIIATLGSILVRGLSASDHDVFWITDQDEIAPNSEKHDHAGHLITHYLGRYFPEKKGKLIFLTTESKIDEYMFDDLVSIPDVAAGALCEYFNYMKKINATIGMKLSLPIFDKLSNKTRSILFWVSKNSKSLKKLFFVIKQNQNEQDIDIHLLKIVLH